MTLIDGSVRSSGEGLTRGSTSTHRPSTGRDRLTSSLGILFLYLVLAVAVFGSAWANPTNLSVGAAGDPELFMWLLAWVPYSISHGMNPLFTNFVIYPQGANLMWTLIPIVPGLLLSPVMAWFGPVLAYNASMTLALALSAWCGYLATNALVGNRVGALVGGLIFGFSPYMLSHSLGHPNLVICVTPPLALLIVAELFVWQRRPAWQPGLALGLLAAAQLLTTPEILFSTAFVGALGAVLLMVMAPRQVLGHFRHALSGLVVATVVFVPIAALPLAFMFLGPQHVGGVVREQDIFVTDLLNFVVPTHVMLLDPGALAGLSRAWTGDDAEWNAYIGVPLIALLAFIAVRWRSIPLVLWSAILGAVIALLSLGPHLHLAGVIHLHVPLPWLWLQHLPVFDNVLPARLMLFFYLVAGLAVAFFVRELRQHASGWKAPAGWAWVGVSLLFLLPAVPWPVTPNPVPEFFSGGGVRQIPAGSVALVAPFSTAPGFQLGPGQDSATYPMLWQVASGMRYRMPEGSLIVPDVNGTPSGGRPPASTTQSTMIAIQQGGPAPDLTPELRAAISSDLSRWKIQTVIVGPMYNQAAMVAFLASLLGREPQLVGGVFVWWGVGA